MFGIPPRNNKRLQAISAQLKRFVVAIWLKNYSLKLTRIRHPGAWRSGGKTDPRPKKVVPFGDDECGTVLGGGTGEK